MPTYEYQCDACGKKFEKFQSIKSAPIRKCPNCGKNKVRRLISTGAGLIFKGSGFYITDYRSESYKEKAKSESGEKSDTAKSDTAKPDSSKSETGKADAAKAEAPAPKSTSAPAPKTPKKK
jgi:putative FmdB family regulatory protein